MQSYKFNGEEYQVQKMLERSTYSTLYLGERATTRQQVILRCWPSAHTHNAQERQRIQAEVSMLQRIQHPNLLPVFDVSETEQGICLVSAFPPGGSLQASIDNGYLAFQPLKDALQIINQIGQALQALHEQGIVHGNITPYAIFFSESGSAYLGECQLPSVLACIQDYQSLLEKGISHYLYMAPEQFHSQPDANSDQYALGCVAYFLLTGIMPFSGSARSTLLQKHQRESPRGLCELNAAIPAHVESAVLKALVKLPNGRHSSVQAFLDALNQAAPLSTSEQEESGQIATFLISEETLPTYAVSTMDFETTLTTNSLWAYSGPQARLMPEIIDVEPQPSYIIATGPFPRSHPQGSKKRRFYLMIPLAFFLLALLFMANRWFFFSGKSSYQLIMVHTTTPIAGGLTPVLSGGNLQGKQAIATVIIHLSPSATLGSTPVKGVTAEPTLAVTPDATPRSSSPPPTGVVPPTVVPTPTPMPTPTPAMSLTPFLNCVVTEPGNVLIAGFGYNNTGSSTLSIPVGEDNFITPSHAGSPITLFPVGENFWAFQITFSSSVTASWTLGGTIVSAGASSQPCIH